MSVFGLVVDVIIEFQKEHSSVFPFTTHVECYPRHYIIMLIVLLNYW